MNKKHNYLVLSALVFLFTSITLVYCLIRFNQYIFVILGITICVLISAYFFINNIVNLIITLDTSNKVLLRNGLDDISSQIEAINSAHTSINKANYVYNKKTYEAVNKALDVINTNNINLIAAIDLVKATQSKTSKAIIKYNDSNTNKLISSIHESKNSISDMYINCFDQFQTDNDHLINKISDLENHMDRHYAEVEEHTHVLSKSNIIPEPEVISQPEVISEQEVIPEPEPAPAVPDLGGDPNKQLSADEIAALFSALG